MLRFLSFLLGIIFGFVFAVNNLKLPGKTFFNKLSKFPPNLKKLIDDLFNLSLACFRFGSSISHLVFEFIDLTTTKILKRSANIGK